MPAPGSVEVAAAWRAAQQDLVEELVVGGDSDFHGDATGLGFLRPDPGDIARPVPMPVLWPPVPRRPLDCLGRAGAREVCDWSPPESASDPTYATLRGGREFHTEYCEYTVVLDGCGRPKRVEITTELRERWLCLARYAPDRLRAEATDALYGTQDGGQRVRYRDLYGDLDPDQEEDPDQRGAAFEAQVAGSEVGGPKRVVPQGRINRDHALFMCQPINGLDDLYFILLLAARRFARRTRGGPVPAPLPWLFLDNPYFRAYPEDMAALPDFYGTHADPAVARAVQLAAWDNRAFSVDPLAAVLPRAEFAADRLVFPDGADGAAERWVRWSRPAGPGLYQRLVVGPGDDEPEWTLADIAVLDSAGYPEPLTGGFQLLELLSAGVMLTVSPAGTLAAPPEVLHPQSRTIPDANAGVRGELVRALAQARGGTPPPPDPAQAASMTQFHSPHPQVPGRTRRARRRMP
jgi:hypothetical protein